MALAKAGHGSTAAAAQVQPEVIGIHDLFGECHQAGTGVNTDDLAVEAVGVVVQIGDGVHVGVLRYDQAEFGAIQIGA